MVCKRCNTRLEGQHGKHRLKAKYLPLFAYDAFIVCWRRKGFCPSCKKIRSEEIGFLSQESPHLTKAYETTIEELTEIAAVSRVAEFTGEDKSTVWRLDYKRLMRLRSNYKVPPVTHISVDEVYARKKHKEGETRNDRFFTIVTVLSHPHISSAMLDWGHFKSIRGMQDGTLLQQQIQQQI